MDNQQDKEIIKLYRYLLENPLTTVTNMAQHLKRSEKHISDRLHKFKLMGLDVCITKNQITLKTKVDAIEVASIQAKTSKPVYYSLSAKSTNKLAAANKQAAIYISEHQSNGVGRQGKTWLTPLGQSIALSISHDFAIGLQQLSGLNIAIGVAIINTTHIFNCQELGLKWPNDILGANGKVAGILIEASGNKHNSRAVIGIGINWNITQQLLDTVEQDCMNIGIESVSRSEFIAQLIVELEIALKEFSQNKLQNLLPIWQQNDVLIGKKIKIKQNGKSIKAKYLGVNQQGQLNIETAGEMISLASGNISIRQNR